MVCLFQALDPGQLHLPLIRALPLINPMPLLSTHERHFFPHVCLLPNLILGPFSSGQNLGKKTWSVSPHIWLSICCICFCILFVSRFSFCTYKVALESRIMSSPCRGYSRTLVSLPCFQMTQCFLTYLFIFGCRRSMSHFFCCCSYGESFPELLWS